MIRRLMAAGALSLALLAACGSDKPKSSPTIASTAPAAAGDSSAGSQPRRTLPAESLPADTRPADSRPADTSTIGTSTADTANGSAAGMPANKAEYVDRLFNAGDPPPPDQVDLARCIATEEVDAIGYDQLVSAGVTPEALNEADTPGDLGLEVPAERVPVLKSKLVECGDLVAIVVSGVNATKEQEACIREAVTSADIAEVIVASGLGQDPAPAATQHLTAANGCIG